jgi:cytosine/adenosine deaminase-related metal-dependent hydrolase
VDEQHSREGRGAVLLRGGYPWGYDGAADVLVRDGKITQIEPTVGVTDAEVVDVAGRLVLPGLVDAHCHLDKTLHGGPWIPHSAGDALADRIANDRTRRGELGLPNADYVTALLDRMVAAGTSYVRTHTDVDPDVGLRGVEIVRAAAERMSGRVTVEQVAFPQHGLLSNPGTAELLEEALKSGVEAVGGLDPASADGDPVRNLDMTFTLAERYGAGVDIHLHDGGTLGAWEIELIAERTRMTGLRGRVAISHAYALGQIEEAYQARLLTQLAEAGVSLVTAAAYSFPVIPIKNALAAGVNVACGHDGIRDLWGPYGSGDMLERAMFVAYRSTFRRDDDIELALDAATYGGSRALGLKSYGLTVGAPADLVVVSARTPAEAVVARPVRELVLKAGRVVARDGQLV